MKTHKVCIQTRSVGVVCDNEKRRNVVCNAERTGVTSRHVPSLQQLCVTEQRWAEKASDSLISLPAQAVVTHWLLKIFVVTND